MLHYLQQIHLQDISCLIMQIFFDMFRAIKLSGKGMVWQNNFKLNHTGYV